MKRFKFGIGWAFIILFLCVNGCATTPKSLPAGFTDHIDQLAFLVSQKGEQLQVLDHTGVWDQTYTGYQYGALGGLVEGLILASIANSRIKESLGGNPDLLRKSAGSIPMERIIYEKIENRFSKRLKINDARNVHKEKHPGDAFNQSSIKETMSDCKAAGADTFIKLDFIYGLAAYLGESASAAIDADVAIWDINSNKALLKKRISTDYLFKSGHPVIAFADDNARLFKEDIDRAADSLALQIAAIFGYDVGERDSKIIHDTVPLNKVYCNDPYLLEQDCSNWIGAKRLIEIDNHLMKISGSNDGKVILVMDDENVSNAAVKCVKFAESFLTAHGIHIIKKLKVVSTGSIDGYFLELDKDGYSILKEHSTERKWPSDSKH